MENERFNFELIDTEAPESVVERIMGRISDETKGYVVATVNEYEGPVASYITKKNSLGGIIGALQPEEVRVDIQTKMGPQNVKESKYEVYLSVKGLAQYKYRLMLLSYKEIAYPVAVVLSDDFYGEYGSARRESYTMSTMKELEELVNTIIESETMSSLLQSLINEALRQEKRQEE